MSPGERKNAGYSPARLSVSEIDSLLNIFNQLKDSTTIKWAIYAAGIGAVAETLHILWLAARYVFKF